MFRRRQPLERAVELTLDGEKLAAARGEPVAAALLAADKAILARSPKLHRPRGPSCFRGGCDGCLMRVDGAPNVMTCLVPVRGGERVETQNVVGSRNADLLRVTDWFFPRGIDHHHFMAGVPGLQDIMQSFARKVAGLGKLPDTPAPARAAERAIADVLVVGGGISGVAVASSLAETGLDVVLVDDRPRLGGSLAPGAFAPFLERYGLRRVRTFSGSTAASVYLGEVLVVTDERIAPGDATSTLRTRPLGRSIVVRPRAVVFATGAHDTALAVPNADLPGIMSARALLELLELGIEPDGPVGIVGDGYFAERLRAELNGIPVVSIREADLVAFRGTADVRRVVVREAAAAERPQRERTLSVTVVAIALPGAPAFELAAQAGASLHFDDRRGYVVESDSSGRAGEGVFALGECAGADFDPQALEARALEVAAAVRAELARGETSFAAIARPSIAPTNAPNIEPIDAPTIKRPRRAAHGQSSMSKPKRPRPPATKTTPKTPSKPK